LGNRELVSVAGMAFAIATNRIALVDWYGVTDNDISDIHQVYDSPSGLLLSYSQARGLWPSWNGWRSEKLLIFDSTNTYNEQWGLNDIVCSHIEDEKHTVLRIITEQYITNFVERNSFVGEKLTQLQPALYQQLSSVFLRPIDAIMDRVENFAEEHFSNKYVIGMQIRRARDSGHFFLWEDQHLFWECAMLMKKRKERDLRRNNKDTQVVYFLATDSELAKEEAMKVLGSDLVLTVDMDTRVPDTRGSEGWQNALVDNYLLSRTDDMIVSGGSTFGYVAHGRSDIIPNVVSGIHHRCLRPVTAEPYNIAYLAIRKATCFNASRMLLQETDMICSSVESVHSCGSHSSLKMAEMHKATKKPHYELGSSEMLPKAYKVQKKKVKERKITSDDVDALLAKARENMSQSKIVKARKAYAKAAALAVNSALALHAGRAFYGIAASYLLQKEEMSNEHLHEAMKAIYQGLTYLPYQVEANILMGNYMEMWGGTPRAHVGVQFYRRAMWCLESAIFMDDDDVDSENGEDKPDDDTEGQAEESSSSHYLPYDSCYLIFDNLQETPEAFNLDALLLTVYVHIQRALKKSGRFDEAAAMDDVMDENFDEETLVLKSQVGGMLSRELVQMMSGLLK